MEALKAFLAWAAPIVSALVVTALTAQINSRVKKEEESAKLRAEATNEKRRTEAEWRSNVDKRMLEQDEKIDLLLRAQCSQIRSDIIHKCHRYLDDLGKACVEEKQSLNEEYEDYQRLCRRLGVENHFVDQLVHRVMGLPEREI